MGFRAGSYRKIILLSILIVLLIQGSILADEVTILIKKFDNLQPSEKTNYLGRILPCKIQVVFGEIPNLIFIDPAFRKATLEEYAWQKSEFVANPDTLLSGQLKVAKYMIDASYMTVDDLAYVYFNFSSIEGGYIVSTFEAKDTINSGYNDLLQKFKEKCLERIGLDLTDIQLNQRVDIPENNPEDFAQALEDFNQGDFNSSFQNIEKVVKNNPSNKLANNLYTKTAIKTNNQVRARLLYNNLKADSIEEPEFDLYLDNLSEDVDEAIVLYLDLLSKDSTFAQAWNNLGKCYLEKEMYEQAEVCLQQALNNNFYDKGVAYNNLGILYTRINQVDKIGNAQSCFKRALQNTHHRSLVLLNYGIAQRKFGFYSESIELLKNALENDPNNNEIKSELAFSLISNKESEKAKALLVSLIESGWYSDDAAIALARIYHSERNYDEALDVLRLDYFNFETPIEHYLEAATLFYNKSDLESAEKYADDALKLDEDYVYSMIIKARIKTAMGNTATARQILDKAFKLTRTLKESEQKAFEALIHFEKASAYKADGDLLLAKGEYKKILSIDPNNVLARILVAGTK